MRAPRSLVLFVSVGVAGGVLAQASAPLPKILSGRWVAVVPGNQTYTDSISVVLDAPPGPGQLTGRLTVRGVACGAIDEPLTGTWDGNELSFESEVRPNVNATRMNGQCGTGHITFQLTRKAGQSSFEGEFRRDGMQAPGQVTLAP